MANIFYKTIYNSLNSFYVSGQIYADPVTSLYLWKYSVNNKYYISEILGVRLSASGDLSGTWYDSYYATDQYATSFWGKGANIDPPFIWRQGSVYYISRGVGFAVNTGVDWWISDTSYINGVAQLYNPQGTASGTVTMTVKPIIGWESSTLLGKYTAVGGESGVKHVGQKKFTDGDAVEYLQSPEKVGSYFTYGDIEHDGTGWVIGTRGTGAWWEGTEPDVDTPVIFVMKGTATANKTITFDSYVANTIKLDFKIFEVPILI